MNIAHAYIVPAQKHPLASEHSSSDRRSLGTSTPNTSVIDKMRRGAMLKKTRNICRILTVSGRLKC
jgi:hypothetical protein